MAHFGVLLIFEQRRAPQTSRGARANLLPYLLLSTVLMRGYVRGLIFFSQS